ncbi:MAG: fibronectin type III domain-containing protein [Bacteroidales bacterium]|nr:fibronectin type III domain-containing protein [Bacteroidales bacterium]
MKALFNFFIGLTFAFLISISLSSQLYASDCECSKTGAYVKPAKGVTPDLNFSTETEAFSPSGNYRLVSGGSPAQYVITIYKVDGNQQLVQLFFSGESQWGFSPDDHRFAFWSLPNQTQQIIKLYNLEGVSPGTPILNEFFSSGQGNQASVRFSPNGNYFVYALITGTNSTFFMAADSKTGDIKYETTISYSTAPGLDGEKYGGAVWGFGPDPNDNNLMLAYLTSGNQQLKWQLLNLSLPGGSTVVNSPDPYSVTSAYWVFSRCGDVFAIVTQISTNVNLRLIKTTDGTTSALYSYGDVSILLQTTATQHQVRIGTDAFADLNPKYPNTAGQACGGNDVTPPSWPAGKMLTASSVTITSVQLDWTPASSETAKYKIFKDNVPLDSVSFNIQSYQVDALQPGTNYDFRIEAADSAGNYTTDGPAVEITTLASDTTPPVWPDTTIFKVHLYSSGSIRLNWTKATDNVGVKYYRTYLNDTLYNQFNANPNSTDYYQNLSGLLSGIIYTIDVVAVDDSGNVSIDGPSRTITFNPDATPQWPGTTILEAKNIGVTTAELHWTAPDYDFAIMAYRVCSDAGSCRNIYAPDYLHNPDTTFLLNYLDPDSAYTYTVVAYGDNDVYSDQSPQVVFRTLPDIEPPEWPLGSSLSTCETGTDYVTLRWDPASDNVGVTNYQVFQNNILINTIENSYPEPKTYKAAGLQPGDTYTFRIVAGDGSGNYSSQSLSAIAQTYKSPLPNQAFPNTSYDYRLINGERTYLVDLNDSGQVIGADLYTNLGFIWENDSSRSLGTLGRPDISPYFINNNGEISGEALMPNGTYMPFFWRNDTIISLGPVIPAANWTVPTAMNDSGVVVGWARYASIFSAGFEKAFSWKSDVLGRNLGTLGGEIYIPSYNRVTSRAIDVNNQGQIVGYSPAAIDSQAIQHGFIWENGHMRDLDSSRVLSPIAINDNGHVLVTEGGTAAKLMVWNSPGSTKTIGTLGGPRSNGKDITENGFVYGSSQTDHVSCNGSYSEHAFIWNGNDIIDLGTMGGENSMALDMNNNGQVVGEAELFNGQKHAFIWQNGIMIDLNPDGYDESTAIKINELGQVIINAYVNSDTVYDEGGEPRIKQVGYGLIANPVQLPDISIDSADTLHFCPGESFNVNYSISNGSFLPDNQFFIVLSDSMSNFISPISLQTEKVSDGVLRGTLPVPFKFSNVAAGSYSIRVISSNPVNFSNEYAINARFGNCSSYMTVGSTGSQFCAGDSLDIPFTVTGSDFNPGNTFAAMLSGSLGDFSKETEIGTLQDTTTGIIAAMIPENISAGSSYRIRIKASAPVFVSQDNGFDIAINQVPAAEISQKGDTLTASSGDAWIWMRDADTLSMDTRSIVAGQAGNYKVTVFHGGCSAESEPYSFSLEGINQSSLKNGIRISPIPSTGTVHINASDEIKAGELTISVYDITGGLITQFHWNKYKNAEVYTLDLGSQPDGLYLMNIINPGEAVYVSKIIIKH